MGSTLNAMVVVCLIFLSVFVDNVASYAVISQAKDVVLSRKTRQFGSPFGGPFGAPFGGGFGAGYGGGGFYGNPWGVGSNVQGFLLGYLLSQLLTTTAAPAGK